MNRFNRLLTRPLFFALIATGMVVAVGEPIEAPSAAQLDNATAACALASAEAPLETPDTIEAIKVEAEVEAGPAPSRAQQAARLRWLITLPHARTSCCRQPV